MKRREHKSYQLELAMVVGFSMLLIITAFSLVLYYRELNNSRIRAVNSLEAAVSQIRENLELEIYILNRLSYSLASDKGIIDILTKIKSDVTRDRKRLELWENTNTIERILFRQTEAWRNIEGILILAEDGSAYYGSGTSFLVETHNFKGDDWYRRFNAQKASSTIQIDSEPAPYLINGFPSLSIIRRIYDPDKAEAVGTMKIDISLDAIKENLSDLKSFGDFNHYIMDSRGYIILPDPRTPQNEINVTTDDILQFAGDDKGVIKDEHVIFPLKINDTPWFLVYHFPLGSVLEGRRTAFILQTLIILAAGVFTAFLSSIIISRSFSRNIIELKNAMEIAESGNLDIQVHFKSDNEIGILAESFNRMTANLKELYQQLYRAEIDTREARIKALQARINPHFMFNTLECIDSLAMVDNNPLISLITRALSNNFKYAFEKGRLATLAEELKHGDDYIQILKIRYPDKIRIRFDIPEDLKSCLLPRLTLQPIIENSVLHGILKSRKPGEIIVSASASDGIISLQVQDNGIGISPEKLNQLNSSLARMPSLQDKHQSGLKNVNNRLKFLFQNNQGLLVFSKPEHGTTIMFSIEIKEEK